MGDRSNVSHRVLNAVRTATGTKDSLENFIGLALVDGAQCFVTDEEANYRWLAKSVLAPDDHFVVKASGPSDQGRWVRESGLTGFAMLEDGEAIPNDLGLVFGKYKTQQLVQFEMTSQETLVYRGAVRRLAMLFGKAQLAFDRGHLSLAIRLNQNSGDEPRFIAAQRIELNGLASVACSGIIEPGARLSLEAIGPYGQGGIGSLRVVLA